MARPGETIENPVTGERITWIETAQSTGGELLAADLYLGPAAAWEAPTHRHVRQEERFAIHSESLSVADIGFGAVERGGVAGGQRGGGKAVNEISRAQRVFFGFIGVNALFVAYLGLAAPERIDRSFTWAVLPPLHARFVGVLYLFGGVYLLGCIWARRWRQVSPALPTIAVFTSLVLLVTLLNLEAFDFDLGPVRVWMLAYIVFPTIALALAWTARGRVGATVGGPALPAWARVFLRVQAVPFAVLGVLLVVAPEAMVDVWPWPITSGLAQFYGGPFLAYAFASWQYSGRAAWAELAAIVPAMLVFAAGTVAVSLVHRELFAVSEPATWVWFVGFGTAAAALLVMSARALSSAQANRRAAG